MRKLIIFCALVISLSVVCTHASIDFNIAATATDMLVDEEVTLTVSVQNGVVDNFGVVEWGFDMWVDGSSTGGVEVVTATVLNDSFYFVTDVSGQNTVSGPGSVTIGTAQFGDPVSDIGVGGYTDIAEVVIKGTSAGSILYNLGTLTTPENFFGRTRDGVSEEGQLDPQAVRNFTVNIPEPSSLLILSGMGIVGFLRRKK